MSSTLADYAGRTVDVAAFRWLDTGRPSPGGGGRLLVQELAGTTDGGAVIAGVGKLAQKVLVVLLTPLGSKQYSPREGTAFMVDAVRGRWRTVVDVSQSFYAARLDVARQLAADATADDPDDEVYATMTLNGVVLSGDRVSLSVEVTTRAGTSYKFLTPLTVPIR